MALPIERFVNVTISDFGKRPETLTDKFFKMFPYGVIQNTPHNKKLCIDFYQTVREEVKSRGDSETSEETMLLNMIHNIVMSMD